MFRKNVGGNLRLIRVTGPVHHNFGFHRPRQRNQFAAHRLFRLPIKRAGRLHALQKLAQALNPLQQQRQLRTLIEPLHAPKQRRPEKLVGVVNARLLRRQNQNPVGIRHQVEIKRVQMRSGIQIHDDQIRVQRLKFPDQRHFLLIPGVCHIQQSRRARNDLQIVVLRFTDDLPQILAAPLIKEIVQFTVGTRPQHRLDIRTAQVGIHNDDAPAPPGDLDRQIDRKTGLPHPAFAPAHHQDLGSLALEPRLRIFLNELHRISLPKTSNTPLKESKPSISGTQY